MYPTKIDADPVVTALNEIQVGATVTGTVRSVMEFGAFIELSPGVEGLVHISEISHERVFSPSQALKVGEVVQAKVLNLDQARRRISLSIKALKDAPREAPKDGAGRPGGGGGGRDRGGRDGKSNEVVPRESDPSMRKLLAKFGGIGKDLKGGLS